MAISQVAPEELGAGAMITAESVAAALPLAKHGKVFDLDAGRFRGQARHYAHPPFDVVTYRTPRGERNQADLDYLRPDVNTVNYGFISELVVGTVHTGAHIDALCHVTCGDRSEWFGGFSADEHLGDNGPLKCDATKIPPILGRGILLDIPAVRGLEALPASYAITVDDVESALKRQDLEIRRGDIILVRTGQMQGWPFDVRSADQEAGISLETAQWLSAREPLAIASDSSAIEVAPSGVKGNTQPVHIHLIIEKGIYIVEWVYMEELAKANASEFLFVCLPLKIQGATGSMVRPVAVV